AEKKRMEAEEAERKQKAAAEAAEAAEAEKKRMEAEEAERKQKAAAEAAEAEKKRMEAEEAMAARVVGKSQAPFSSSMDDSSLSQRSQPQEPPTRTRSSTISVESPGQRYFPSGAQSVEKRRLPKNRTNRMPAQAQAWLDAQALKPKPQEGEEEAPRFRPPVGGMGMFGGPRGGGFNPLAGADPSALRGGLRRTGGGSVSADSAPPPRGPPAFDPSAIRGGLRKVTSTDSNSDPSASSTVPTPLSSSSPTPSSAAGFNPAALRGGLRRAGPPPAAAAGRAGMSASADAPPSAVRGGFDPAALRGGPRKVSAEPPAGGAAAPQPLGGIDMAALRGNLRGRGRARGE
ncbi:MAG: hypothetical protein Q8P67_22915, partial [archaeon]|nr:hypothetical protein [archaeon]